MEKNIFEIVEDKSSFYFIQINSETVGRYCWDDAVDVLSFINRMKQRMEVKTGLHPVISFQEGMITLSTYLTAFSFSTGALMLEDIQNSVKKQLDEYLAEYTDNHRSCQSVVSTGETRIVFHGGNR